MGQKTKKSKSKKYEAQGETFAEQTIKKNTFHPAQNSPAKPHNR